MNAKPLVIAFALAVSAGASFAAEATPGAPLTRAEVRAEYERARIAGELPQPTDSIGGYVYARPTRSTDLARARPQEDAQQPARTAARQRSGPAM